MKNSRLFKFVHIADLVICSVWLLLLAHEEVSSWMMNPFILLFPALRIWVSFLMQRESKLMIVPVMMLVLLAFCISFDRNPGFFMFVSPWKKILTSTCALFSLEFISSDDLHELICDVCKNVLNIVGYLWLVIYPLTVYVYKRVKKQLIPGTMGIWKCIGMCAYILGCAMVSSIILSVCYKTSICLTVLAFMLMLIPIIFYRNNIRMMFTRSEVVYLLTIVMFILGYVCGISFDLKSAITVCTLPAVFYALVNWYIHRETTYKDVLLIVGASVVFWCAQYTTNMVRISLLLLSLVLMAVAVIRFAIDTNRNRASIGLYVMIAFVMPVFCLGYNPYSVLEASRAWHFDRYCYSRDGILCVRAGDTKGLRDRYGVILPVDRYKYFELLSPFRPYCKVGKAGRWQIYDIELHKLVSEEWFEDVISCDEYIYRLKSQNGDKYLTLRRYYDSNDEQPIEIVDEMPVNN